MEEATLLFSWFPTCVEHPALVWTVLLHRARHHCLVTVTHYLSRMSSCTTLQPPSSSRVVTDPQRGPRWGRQRRPSTLWRPLLTWLICPQKKVAVPSVALVELATLVGAVFAHSEEERILTTITHNDITVGVYTGSTTTTCWRARLWSPGGDRRKRRARI